MVDLARCLVMANNNSPITLQIKNVTTLGRHCTEFLKWSKFKDYDFYEKKHISDKINELDNEIRFSMNNPDRN